MPDVTITADILSPNAAPALSATSDMPSIDTPAQTEGENAAPTTTEGSEAATEAVAAEGDEGEAGAETAGGEEAEGEAKPAKRSGISERFSTLTEQRKAAERERDTARTEAEQARQQAERLAKTIEELSARLPKEPEVKAAEPELPARPQPTDFETPDAYDKALIEWSAKQALAVERVEREQHDKTEREAKERDDAAKAQQAGIDAAQAKFAERRATFVEAHPDFAEIAERDDLKISLPMAVAITSSEDGPAAAYHLGQNPELAERIAGMVIPGQVFPEGHQLAGQPVPDVQRQLIEMGKVFAAVEAQAKPAAPTPPPPPAPINPLRRGNNAAVPREPDAMSMEEYAAQRMPKLRAERRASGILGGSA